MIEHSNKTEVSAAHDFTGRFGSQICLAGSYCTGNLPKEYLCRHQLANKSLSTYTCIRFE